MAVGIKEKFPVGMRVLVVDDTPICLKLLEAMLKKCQYHVTTASQAKVALKMLRETPNRFDLVITDVYLADMDGFEFLEIMSAEIDLPVIMMCADNDPELVRKGVIHGACEFLSKPVLMPELRNIWQHVIRREKFDTKKNINASSSDPTSVDEERRSPLGDNTDQNAKIIGKRKDEKNVKRESDEPGKKQRVVWTKELHDMFLAALHQLGIENAVPKKILDLMNVEGISRENVASHLQKYRLNLKRNNPGASQDKFPLCMGPVNMLIGSQHLDGATIANNRTLMAYQNAPSITATDKSSNFATLSTSTDPRAAVFGSRNLSNNSPVISSPDNMRALSGGGYGIPVRSGYSYLQDSLKHAQKWEDTEILQSRSSCSIPHGHWPVHDQFTRNYYSPNNYWVGSNTDNLSSCARRSIGYLNLQIPPSLGHNSGLLGDNRYMFVDGQSTPNASTITDQSDSLATESRAMFNDGNFLSEHRNIEDGFTSQSDHELWVNGLIRMDHDEANGNCEFSFDPSLK